MRASSRKLLFVLVGLAILGFLIYRSRGFFRFGDFSGAKFLYALRGANPYLLLLGIVAIYGCYGLRALRWEVFQRNLGPSHFWNIYKLTLAGFASVVVLGRAGEPVRPLLLARKEKLPASGMFGIYVLERLFDAASTAVIAAIGLILFQSQSQAGQTASVLQTAARTTGSVLFVGVLVVVGVLIYLRVHGTALLERKLQGSVDAHGVKARVARIVLGFARGVQTIRTWTDLALAVLYSAAHWFLVLMVYFWVSHSFGGTLAQISLGGAMLLMAFTSAGSTVQIPGVGGGSQAGSIIAYTAIFGVEREPAVAAAIALWLTTWAACTLAGVPLLIHEGWSLGELREMAKHEEEVEKEAASGPATPIRRGESAE
jgi:glycosyltransferase 2 family protein